MNLGEDTDVSAIDGDKQLEIVDPVVSVIEFSSCSKCVQA
jgi:hypothetical protein